MKLQSIIDAGGWCAWSGAQRRTLIPLCRATEQGSGGGTVLPSPPEGDVPAGRLKASGAGRATWNDMSAARRGRFERRDYGRAGR